MFKTAPFNGNGLGISSRSLGKPASAFPAAIATDHNLAIAVDRLQTTLASPLDSVTTTMTVTNAGGIVANMLLSIDSEIVQVTGAPTGTQVPISRGFDGTTPALHLGSAAVSGFVDAYHHNTLVAEIEAIETALGPNLSRVPGSASRISSAYNFTPQTPGGSLVVGNNSITLTPVPQGVNGTDPYHYLYVSGGTGTAEAVLITGGSAVSGAASGTLIIQCANTHSGAWTIQSASSGIQEAIDSYLPLTGDVLIPYAGGGIVQVPGGQYSTYAPITVFSNIWLGGVSCRGTILVAQLQFAPVIQTSPTAYTAGYHITDLSIKDAAANPGWIGITINDSTQGDIRNLEIYGQVGTSGIGIYKHAIAALSNMDRFTNIIINNVNEGIRINGTMAGSTEYANTNELFDNIYFNIGYGPAVNIIQYSDTNYFSNLFIGWNGSTNAAIVDGSGSTTLNMLTGDNNFVNIVAIATVTPAISMQFNNVSSDVVLGLHSNGNPSISQYATGIMIYGHDVKDAGGYYHTQHLPNKSIIEADTGTGTNVSVLSMLSGNIIFGGSTGTYIQCQSSLLCMNGILSSSAVNEIPSETGANNAIAGTTSMPLASGLEVNVLLAHTLQAGPNTFNYSGGGAVAIKKHTNPASDLTIAYAVGGFIKLIYNGSVWLDSSQ